MKYFVYLFKVYSCYSECKALDVHWYDPECKASELVRTYKLFPQSLLDITGAIPGQGSVPLSPQDKNLVRGRLVAKLPQPLEWLASRKGWTIISSGRLIILSRHEKRHRQKPRH